MSLKHPLLITLTLLSATSTVHSQTAGSPPLGATRPAALFDAPSAAAEPTTVSPPGVLDIRRSARPIDGSTDPAVSSGSMQPWMFNRPTPAATDQDGTLDQRADSVDISALRYFASQNDLQRVAAEIRLLRAKSPGWEPPEDLFSQVSGSEIETPLWDLFAKHDIEGVKAAIDELRQSKPDWQPSTDLLNKVALAEARDDLVRASDGQQWGAVLDIAASHKMLMTCGDIDALWRTAEALIRTGDDGKAVEAYRYVLTSCRNPEQRLATVQKASLLLQAPEDVDALIRLGRRLGNGKSEFEQVRLDLLRRKLGDAAAGKAGATPPSQADIDALTAHAKANGDGADAQLLGWYAYSRKDFVEAESWFRIALKPGPNSKAAEGLVMTLRDVGKLPEAQTLAEQYAGLDPMNLGLMVQLKSAALDDPKQTPLSPDQLTRLAGAIDTVKSAEAAQAYGWHLYKAEDLAGAETWFRKSVDWKASEPAALGLILSAKRLGHQRDYATLMTQYKAVYPKLADLDASMRPKRGGAARVASAYPSKWPRSAGSRGHDMPQATDAGERGWDKSASAIVKIYEGGNYDQAVALLEQRKASKGSEPNGLSIVRGWAMYKKGDWEGAKQVFTNMQAKGFSRDAQEGLRVIQLGYTNPRYR